MCSFCFRVVKGNTCVLVALLISCSAEYPSGQMLWTNVKQTLLLHSWSWPRKKTVTSVTVEKTEHQLHVMNALQGTGEDLGDIHTQSLIHSNRAVKYTITCDLRDQIERICPLSLLLDKLCGNIHRKCCDVTPEEGLHPPSTNKSKCGIDFF